MSACNIYNEKDQQLLVKFFDTVTASDLEEQARLLASNKTVGAARRKCISFLTATAFAPDITRGTVRTVVAIMRDSLKSGQGVKTAFVAPGQEALSISLMFQECLKTAADPGEVKVFTSKEEAIGWLGGGREQWRQMREHVARMCSL